MTRTRRVALVVTAVVVLGVVAFMAATLLMFMWVTAPAT